MLFTKNVSSKTYYCVKSFWMLFCKSLFSSKQTLQFSLGFYFLCCCILSVFFPGFFTFTPFFLLENIWNPLRGVYYVGEKLFSQSLKLRPTFLLLVITTSWSSPIPTRAGSPKVKLLWGSVLFVYDPRGLLSYSPIAILQWGSEN